LTRRAIERHGLYYSNQNTYVPAGLRSAGREFLQHDWFAQTRPPHLAFTYLVAALDRLQVLSAGFATLELLLEASLLLAVWLIAGGLYRSLARHDARLAQDGSRLALTTLAFALLLLGVQHPSALRDLLRAQHGDDMLMLGQIWERVFFLGGLAAQYVWGGYLQPSEFGILFLLAIGVMLFERWRLGTFLAGLAALMHTGYLPHAALLALVTAGWLVRSGRRRLAAESLAIFGVSVLPVVIYALTFAFQSGSAEAYDILANFRTPHHSQPSVWWSGVALGQLAIMAAAGLLLLWKRMGFLSWVMAAGFAYTSAGIVLVWFVVDSDALAFSHPWRGSAYLVPLSLFVIAAFAVAYGVRLLQRLTRRAWPPAWFATAAGLLILISTGARTFDAQPRPGSESRSPVAAMVSRETAPDDVILVPESWENFRLEAERPVYVDYKSHPYLPSEVLEWRRRIQTSRRFYKADESERGAICAEERIDYYVISTDVPVATHRQVAEAAGHWLVACPST
jgi:hypothetical protein